jgi:Fe/S biogenesis protein NfuA
MSAPELNLSAAAGQFFVELIEKQARPFAGIRLTVEHAGTPQADVRLSFCEAQDIGPDDVRVALERHALYVAGDAAPWLDRAQIDYVSNNLGGQLEIKAPDIKGKPPAGDASLVEQVQHLLTSEINPTVAQHGGRVSLVEITEEGIVVLRFGGGCQGCGMKDVTLKQGVEKTLLERVPGVSGVRDITDHASGANPYFRA